MSSSSSPLSSFLGDILEDSNMKSFEIWNDNAKLTCQQHRRYSNEDSTKKIRNRKQRVQMSRWDAVGCSTEKNDPMMATPCRIPKKSLDYDYDYDPHQRLVSLHNIISSTNVVAAHHRALFESSSSSIGSVDDVGSTTEILNEALNILTPDVF